MSTRAQALGAVGSVIDGRFRDVQEQRDLAYPVKNLPTACYEIGGGSIDKLFDSLGLRARRGNGAACRVTQGRGRQRPRQATDG